MKPIDTPLYLFLILHTLTLFVTGQSPPPYTAVDDIVLACGSSGQQTSDDLREWSGDNDSKFTPIGNASESIDAPRSSTATDVPYTKARLSRSEFTYTIPLSPGQKFLRLHFNPDTYTPNFQRTNSLFSVTAGGFTLLKDFNASVNADASGEFSLVREFCVNIETGQRLTMTFTPSKDAYAFINGIEVVSMPTGLYYTSLDHTTPQLIGSTTPYPIGNQTALEMMYRINVGGKFLSPAEDTGMYRSWDSNDRDYLDSRSKEFSVLPQNNTIELTFSTIPAYTAPKSVYNTGRSMGMNKTINKSYNLTWIFPLDPRFYYLMRLHFCEFESDITKSGDRSFQIFIANQIEEESADVIGWSKANGNPVYRDYVVFLPQFEGQKKVDLFLALTALQNDLYTEYNDAILNGLEIFKLSDTTWNLAGPNPDPLPGAGPNPDPLPGDSPKVPPKSTSKKKSISMAAIIAGVASGLVVLSVLGCFIPVRSSDSGSCNRRMKLTTTPGTSYPCRCFSLAEIKAATKNFSDTFIIGAGGFGNVYKGCIDSGATPVAIKRRKPESSQGLHEFETEIEMLSQLRHRHLVSLIGYCTDKGEMILVYDYMAQGTLRDHLYHTSNQPLPWQQRLQICIGAARGLQYLHNGAKGTIIHRDVKSTNILLDEKWVAKVSDFGLSKGTTNLSKTHISTIVKGSFGYLDPEYYRRQRLTEKSDVYSFGVVLCEVLCARPAVIQTDKTEPQEVNLAEWAKSCHENGELDQIIDPCLRGKIGAECLDIFVDVAISCMHNDGTQRPSMNGVVRGLELAMELQPSAEANIGCTKTICETDVFAD